jgi:uncharacterized protein (TIGR02271 family)
MSKTVVGLFSTMQQANQVKQALVSDGYDAGSIRVVANDTSDTSATNTYETGSGSATANPSGYTDIGSGGGTGIGEKISHFFRSLAGGDDAAHHHYAKGVNEGGALLAVTVPDDEADEVASLLSQHGAKDIDDSYEGSAAAGKTAYDDTFSRSRTETADARTSGETAIPVIEEQLTVGKREVDRGGVRVYSHVVERPVDTDVQLREERINVERRAVNRPATAADFTAGNGGTIELNAVGEEAVVGKTSRVVEEVLVGKEANERTETIHDSVRRTEVEVEEVEGERVGASRQNPQTY